MSNLKKANKRSKIHAILFLSMFLVVGIALLFLYFYKLKDSNNYVNPGTTDGEVVDYYFQTDALDYCDYYYNRSHYGAIDADYYRNRCTAAIVVEYYVDESKYTVTSSTYSSDPKRIGAKVKVKYDKDDPEKAVIESDDLTGKILIVAIGSIFTLVGAGGIVTVIVKKMEE